MQEWILENWVLIVTLYLFIAATFGRMYATVSCEIFDRGITDFADHFFVFPFTSVFRRGGPVLALFRGDRARRVYLWIASLCWVVKISTMLIGMMIVLVCIVAHTLFFLLSGLVVGAITLFWRGLWTDGLSPLLDKIPPSERQFDQA